MISLTLSREPEWLDLTHGVTVLIRPLTAAIFSAARADLAADDLIDAEAQEIAAALVKAIARRTILSWDGVGDAAGNPGRAGGCDDRRALRSLADLRGLQRALHRALASAR